MKRSDVDSFLNTISFGWQKHDSGWVNERKYQYIRMAQKGTLVYFGERQIEWCRQAAEPSIIRIKHSNLYVIC